MNRDFQFGIPWYMEALAFLIALPMVIIGFVAWLARETYHRLHGQGHG